MGPRPRPLSNPETRGAPPFVHLTWRPGDRGRSTTTRLAQPVCEIRMPIELQSLGTTMASAEAQAPLLASDPDREEDDAPRDDDGASTDAEAAEGEEGPPSLFVWLLTLSAGISGFLFGCTVFPSPPPLFPCPARSSPLV